MTKISLLFLCLLCASPSFSQKRSALKAKAMEVVEDLQPQITEVCQKLWDLSETALLEKESAMYLANMLEAEGFKVERNVSGMPTAFIATVGSGSPSIGILAEYDALPGTGNQPVPYRKAREDGVTSGQGCGHNLFGSGCVNAAIALKRVMEQEKIGGTLKLFGTPAEETGVGKIYMARDGVFDDMDVVLEWHPNRETKVTNVPGLALNNFEVEFFGQAAHGAADPWNGRSALDAVEMMNYGVNLMREHIKPTARIHYVIADGGGAPNVVPEYARVWYFVRDVNRTGVDDYYQRILKIAEGAALATGTTHKVNFITGLYEYNLNEPLLALFHKNLTEVGPPQFTAEEQKWGRELQKFVGAEESGFHTGIEALDAPPPEGTGSTDVADVSYIVPTAGFAVATAPIGVPWHSWATTASHGTAAGRKGAVVATKVLVLTALDLYADPKLIKEAKDYFDKQTGGAPYKSALPDGQKLQLPE